MKSHCLDSSAWIEIFHAGTNAEEFLKVLTDGDTIIVSTVSLYEVWKYTALHADDQRATRITDAMRQHPVVPIDAKVAIQAAEISLRRKIPMADSLIYATARDHQATLWTQDTDFEGLPHVRYFPKTKP